MSGLSPQMRRLVRRGMSPEKQRTAAPERSPEETESRAAKREERRLVREFWSKQPHGLTLDDLRCVRVVNLGHCHLSNDDGLALASQLTKELRQLKELHLYGNRFNDGAMQAFAAKWASGATPFLTRLHLGHNAIGDAGLLALTSAIADHKALARLEHLTLEHNRIGADGASALAQIAADGALQLLTCLGLSGNPIGDAGVTALATACADEEVLPKLEQLHLRATQVSADGGLNALGDILLPRTGGMPSLRTLVVDVEHLEHIRLKEAYVARTGHGGVHMCKMVSDVRAL